MTASNGFRDCMARRYACKRVVTRATRTRPVFDPTGALLSASLVAIVLCWPGLSRAWWDTGHQIVAEVAADRLNPHAKAAVSELLKQDPSGQTLVAVAGWADTVRKTPMPQTYNWHFVDIPVDGQPETYDAARDCKPNPQRGDCIVAALDREVPLLTDPNASLPDRAQALKFVTHLVADLHQPLHCAERNGDGGGNGVKVTFFGATNEAPPFQDSSWNLHAVWDGGLIDHSGETQAAYVKHLEDWIATQDVTVIESGTFADWANETHRQAVEHAYRTADGSQEFPAVGGEIGQAYYDANIVVVDEQLAKAGVRLAAVLNRAFPHTLASPAAAQVITAQEAAHHVGSVETVCGVVASAKYATSTRGQPTFLDLDRPYPNQIFTVVIWGADRAKFHEAPETAFQGHTVCVSGLVSAYRGKPETVVSNPTAIRLQSAPTSNQPSQGG